MRKALLFILPIIVLASCAKNETPKEEGVVKKQQTINARSDKDTKVSIDSNDNSTFQHKWQSTDKLSVFDGSTNVQYSLVSGDGETSASFSGDALEESAPYFALSPYDSEATISEGVITTHFPATQVYTANSYDPAAMVMVAKADNAGDVYSFKLATTMMQITLTPSSAYTVKKVEITANGGESIAGTGQVNYHDGTPTVTMTEGVPTVTVTFGAGLAMTAGTPYTFYVAFPAVSLSNGVSIAITSSANNVLLGKTNNSLTTFARNHVDKMPAITAVPNVPNLALTNSADADLAVPETANCYVINASGTYAIPIDVKGNSHDITLKGLTSAQELWDDSNNIGTLTLYGKYLKFVADASNNGNALVAVKVGENIVWSWHLWTNKDYTLGDDDITKTYSDYTYTYMAVNLGTVDEDATAAPTGESPSTWYYTGRGCWYQWGRKDPITLTSTWSHAEESSAQQTIEWSVANPTKFSQKWQCGITHELGGDTYYPDGATNVWSGSSNGQYTIDKTIYDPSPVGYSVPPQQALANVAHAGNGLWDFDGKTGVVWGDLVFWTAGCDGVSKSSGTTGSMYAWPAYATGRFHTVSEQIKDNVPTTYRVAAYTYYNHTQTEGTIFPGTSGDLKNGYSIRPVRTPN